MMVTWQRIVLRAVNALEPGLKFISRGMTNWVPAVVLITGIAFWRITADIETIGPRIICAAACLAAIRAARNARYFWFAAFAGIAVIFNPFRPGHDVSNHSFRTVFRARVNGPAGPGGVEVQASATSPCLTGGPAQSSA